MPSTEDVSLRASALETIVANNYIDLLNSLPVIKLLHAKWDRGARGHYFGQLGLFCACLVFHALLCQHRRQGISDTFWHDHRDPVLKVRRYFYLPSPLGRIGRLRRDRRHSRKGRLHMESAEGQAAFANVPSDGRTRPFILLTHVVSCSPAVTPGIHFRDHCARLLPSPPLTMSPLRTSLLPPVQLEVESVTMCRPPYFELKTLANGTQGRVMVSACC